MAESLRSESMLNLHAGVTGLISDKNVKGIWEELFGLDVCTFLPQLKVVALYD